MNFFLLANIWSFRRELWYVTLAFLGILLMPLIAVVILTHTGINVVSDKLATVNSKTDKIQIRDPRTGSVVKEIDADVAWPVTGVITLEFGIPHLPYQAYHTGIDIANPYGKIGDPITPFMEGTVIYAGEIWWGYGKHIIIDHGNNISSLYAHLDKIYVYKGQKVKLGEMIGREGSTGWSTGPHLHFEVELYGIPINPRIFLGEGYP